MTYEEAEQCAEEWLKSSGYEVWTDGTWHFEGHEVNVLSILSEYIESRG